MPIKQIQLRGISRTPSDRQSTDGGCAESLNVHLDNYETAPTLPASDVSLSVYPSSLAVASRYKIEYIHKMRGVTNYIGHDGTHVEAYGSTLGVGTGHAGIDYMGNAVISDPITHVTSIGNTLIIYTDNSPYYFLFKGDAYTYLGTAIPKPMIEVASYPSEVLDAWATIEDEVLQTDITKWDGAALQNNEHHGGLLKAVNDLWDAIAVRISENRANGIFVAPFFLRYALRLYDGTYIHSSCPILCGGGTTQNWVRLYVATMGTNDYMMNAKFKDAFVVNLHGSLSMGNWADIVKSIDFFVSTPIYAPNMYALYESMVAGSHEIITEGMGSDSKEKTIREEVFSKGQFYKVLSIDTNDSATITSLSNGTYYFRNGDNVSGDALLAEGETMTDPYRDGQQYIPLSGTTNFNNRLLMYGVKETLTRGDIFLNGQVATGWGNYNPSQHRFTLRFNIVDSVTGKSHYVLAHYRNDGNELYPAYYALESNVVKMKYGNESSSGEMNPCVPYAWICYPDTRCKEVEVFYYGSSTGKKIPMEQHPYLECSCAFLGFGVALDNLTGYTSVTKPSSYTENREIVAGNKLFLSEFENPFLFPAGNIVSFQDNLIGGATTTVPLSEGQFGEFPMYVFTEGGIRVLVTTAEGTFSANMTNPNLSRHVAIPGTIIGIEQAVIFITKRGVMRLSGNTVTELSEYMNGSPFVLNKPDGSDMASISTNLLSSSWAAAAAAANNDETFMGFMKSARPAYDFNGSRMLFFKQAANYHYEYRFKTGTWHKCNNAMVNIQVLNSYPDCLVSWGDQGGSYVLSFSTPLDDKNIISDTQSPVYGLIATRPIDLGEPDIRKSIRSIRVRGKFNREDVQYMLLGSMDDINWHWMKSLRAGSYKLFRIILLTRLTAMERITWIDVDYETRFTNRLR